MKMHSIPAVVLTLFFKIARTSPIFDALPSINDPEHDQITVPNPLSNPSSWNFFGEKYQDGFPTSDSKLVSFNSMNLDLNPELKDPQAQFSVPDTQLNQPIVPLPLPQHTGSINGGLELASSASSNLFLSNLDSQTDLRLPSSLPSYKFIRDGSGVCWRCPQRNNEKIYFATCDGQNLNCSRYDDDLLGQSRAGKTSTLSCAVGFLTRATIGSMESQVLRSFIFDSVAVKVSETDGDSSQCP